MVVLAVSVVAGDVVKSLLVAAGLLLHEQVALLRALAVTELIVLGQVLLLWHKLYLLLNGIDKVHEAITETLLLHRLVKLASFLGVLLDAKLALKHGYLAVKLRFLHLIRPKESSSFSLQGLLFLHRFFGNHFMFLTLLPNQRYFSIYTLLF